jgi:hypothetical protein
MIYWPKGEHMARGKTAEDLTTLQMALVGYEIERRKIEDKIREIQAQLKGKTSAVSAGGAPRKSAGVKRVLSPAARKRIASAQKRRWADYHKRQALAAKAE